MTNTRQNHYFCDLPIILYGRGKKLTTYTLHITIYTCPSTKTICQANRMSRFFMPWFLDLHVLISLILFDNQISAFEEA